MAKSRFEYVKNYELPDSLLPNTYTVVRVDGRGFHKYVPEMHGVDEDFPTLMGLRNPTMCPLWNS